MTTYIPVKFKCLLVALGIFSLHEAYATVSRQEYDALIKSTKGTLSAEQLAPVIGQLQIWHLADPKDKRIVYDLAVVLDKAGDYPAAGLYYQQIVQANAPAFAISAVAHAALKNKHFQEAEAAYQLLIIKTPGDINAHVGLVYAWMGQQRIDQAFDYVFQHLPDRAEQYSVKDLPMIIALAELYEVRKEWLQAASVYKKALQLNPESRYTRRGLVFALSEARVPHLARHYADQYPLEFNENEKYRLALDNAALTIRFGEAQLYYVNNRSRFNTINIAVAQNTELTTRFGDIPKTKFDRIVALSNRGDMQESVRLYRTLVDAGTPTPSYVKFSAAKAYLFLEQPEAARDLYLQGLSESNDIDSDTLLEMQISLMYAYSEAGQYQAAEALIDEVVAKQRKIIFKGMAGLERSNPNYLRADLEKTKLQTNNDRLNRAEEHLNVLRAEAPFNNEIRDAWSSLQIAREHPRAALDEYSLMLIDEPALFDAKVGRGEILLSLNEFAQAKKVLPPLLETNPENKSVQNFAEKLDNYGKPFYKIETTFGQGSVSTGADTLVDAIVYSAPLTNLINDHFRLFSHLAYANGATIDNETASRRRLGFGMDYRARDITVEAEVNHTLDDPNSNGVALAVGWNISDAWFAQAAIDTNSIDLPAAALLEEITASTAKLNLTWSMNESRKIGGGLSNMRFSDGNVRDSANINWMERWISTPVFKFDTLLYLGTSHNSEINRNYFNPGSDRDVSLSFDVEWLNWRRYRRSFKQLASVGVGQYWQSGFDSGATGSLRYAHQWNLENETEIIYGIGRSFQPFDGVREYRKYIFLTLSGRIK